VVLDRRRIIAEAVALLDDRGFDGLTMRNLAARLDVRAPSLYWHVRNKASLIAGVTDAILADELDGIQPIAASVPWQHWLADVAFRMRRAMLAHPDGARVVAAAHLSLALADVSELTIRSLVDHGLSLRQARLTVLCVEAFTIGHVLEEQSPRPDAEAIEGFDQERFAATHPTVVAAIAEYFEPGRTVDDLFADGIALILR